MDWVYRVVVVRRGWPTALGCRWPGWWSAGRGRRRWGAGTVLALGGPVGAVVGAGLVLASLLVVVQLPSLWVVLASVVRRPLAAKV